MRGAEGTALWLFREQLKARLSHLKGHGVTRKHFSQMVGIRQPTLNGILNGKHGVSVELLDKMAKALDVPVAELFRPIDQEQQFSGYSPLVRHKMPVPRYVEGETTGNAPETSTQRVQRLLGETRDVLAVLLGKLAAVDLSVEPGEAHRPAVGNGRAHPPTGPRRRRKPGASGAE